MHELYEPDENNLPNHANVLEKIENGTVTLGDLLDPELLGAIEKYLERKYRENDLTIDPGIEILEDPDFEKFLESLIKDV